MGMIEGNIVILSRGIMITLNQFPSLLIMFSSLYKFQECPSLNSLRKEEKTSGMCGRMRGGKIIKTAFFSSSNLVFPENPKYYK